ncbi:Uncharacterised protein [Klebsiella michiganensis]|nr:Uncharacterised protein [Klebsiella michiganensis]
MAGTNIAQRGEVAGAVVIIFEEKRVDVNAAKQHLGYRLVAALGRSRSSGITATHVQANGQVLRLPFQGLIQNVGIDARQFIRIFAAIANLLSLLIGAEVGPDGVIKL